MNAVRMHADELLVDEPLVRRLLAAQFSQWAELPVERVPSDGTENFLFRLGDELVARLPRVEWAASARATEHEWLPRLAGLLPVEIPEPVALGEPSEEYPLPWSVYGWIAGERPEGGRFDDIAGLVSFLRALRRAPVEGAPPARGGRSLAGQHEAVTALLQELADEFDAEALWTVWQSARAARAAAAPVWVHADLLPANLLVRGGRLAAVIDWGCLGVGDPAWDVSVAWTLLDAERRTAFRNALAIDDTAWARSRGWAIATALPAIPYYRETNPGLVANARYRLEQVLKEVDA